ncbi:hypothetical protein J7K28_04630, partial [Candidatus Aerophobetes bacterium]|nr:hypothetical protein [Candidatus Aerophobetes bacterium]
SQSYSGKLEIDAKRIIYATSKKEVLEEFKVWKERYKNLALKAIVCLKKDLPHSQHYTRTLTYILKLSSIKHCRDSLVTKLQVPTTKLP